MRLYLPAVFTVFILLSTVSTKLVAQNNASYGPEVSAEDFALHVASLSLLNSTTMRKDYIAQQFNRLGLASRNLVCKNKQQGIYATLGNTANKGITTQYIAQLENVYQLASTLEIAERFMTELPRPSHDIRFSFVESSADVLLACTNLNGATRSIQPIGMENLDSSSLVRDLNALYLEGK